MADNLSNIDEIPKADLSNLDEIPVAGTTEKKNSISENTSVNQEASTSGSKPASEPSTKSGAGADYEWGSGIKTPLATGVEGTSLSADVYRTETTNKLKSTAVRKQDAVAKNYSAIKGLDKVINFAAEYPELKQVQDLEAQLTAMGKVTKPEDIKAFNELVAQREKLLQSDVIQKSFLETQPIAEIKTEKDFDTPSDFYAYQRQQQNEFAEMLRKKDEHEEVSKNFSSPKLKDVIGVVDGASKKQQELLTKIKDDQKIADASIKEAQALNMDKLVPLGFGAGFMEGMEQTTLTNTIADLYISGKEEDLQKALENVYTDAVVFPKETTNGGAVGELIGGQVKPLAVGIGGAVASELTTGNPLLGIGAGTAYYGRMGVGSGLMDGYTTARLQGKTQTEAYEIAKQQAKVSGVAGAVEGAVAAIPFLGKPISKIATSTFKKAVMEGLKDNAVDAVVAGVSQVVQNKNLQKLGLDRETSEGVAENMGAEFILGSGMNLAFYAGANLKPKDYKAILVGLSEIPLADIQKSVDGAVRAGVLDEAKAQKTMGDLLETKKAVDAMPDNLTPEEKLETTPIVQEIQKLQKEVEKSGSVVPSTGTEARIEELQREFNEKTGAGLTEKEAKEYEKLLEKKEAVNGEGKKTPLLEHEKSKLAHYNERINAAEKKRTIIEKERAKNEEEIAKKNDIELEPTVTEKETATETKVEPNIFEKIEEAKRSKKSAKEKQNAAREAVKDMGELGEKAIFVDENFNDIKQKLSDLIKQGTITNLKIEC